uniref:Uncharacterized protein n=1 Tax=Rhizophora mucronata TaxID=61149 RepID=A0A2P2NSZ4_RHIMU
MLLVIVSLFQTYQKEKIVCLSQHFINYSYYYTSSMTQLWSFV